MKLKKFGLNTFHLYVLKELLQTFFLSLFVLTLVLVLARIQKITDLIINKGVEIEDIARILLYSSPPSLTFTLPMSFLLSTMVALGRLSTENELFALRTSGISLRKIYIPVSLLGVCIAIFGLLNTFFFLPKSSDLFKDALIRIVKKGITIEDREGVFNDSIPGIVIYIDKVHSDKGYFSGIIVSDEREKNVTQIVCARKGIIDFDSSNLNLTFLLSDGVVHRWEKEKDVYRNLSFNDYRFTVDINAFMPKNKPIRKRLYEMGTHELQEILKREKDDSRRYEILLEIYKRLSLPASTLSFILLAVPLGIKRRVEGKFTGIIYSLCVFVSYYLLVALTDYVGKTFMLSPLLTAFIPNIFVGLAGLILTKEVDHEEYTDWYRKIKLTYLALHEKAR